MEFITEEIAKELNLTPDQIAGIKPLYENDLATKKQGWDTLANDNAEKIIIGAITATTEKFKIDLPREQGEKNADYLARLNAKVVETNQSNIQRLEKELAQKVKDFNGGEATKEELQKAQKALDEAQLKLVDYDDLKAKAGQLEEIQTKYSSLEERVYFQNEKPSFPDTVNKYEAEAKWNAFLKSFDEKWNREFDDKGNSIAVSKENPHLKKTLKELVEADTELKPLLEGRKQEGTGGKTGGKKLEGLEIELPENPTSEDKSKAINAYLDAKGIPKLSRERTQMFTETLKKIDELLKK